MKLSVTRINSMNYCPKQHSFAYTQNLEPITSGDALDVGKSVHAGVEHFYKTGAWPVIEDDGGDVSRKVISASTTYALVAKLEDRFEVVDVERKFSVTLDDFADTEFTGIIDAVVRIDGQLWLHELKTCAQHWSNERIQTANQHVLYEIAAEELYGETIHGTVYTFLRITKRAGEFHTDARRVHVPANVTTRARVYDDFLQVARLILADHSARNSGMQCGYCRFFALCQADLLGGDLDVLKSEFYKPRREVVADDDG